MPSRIYRWEITINSAIIQKDHDLEYVQPFAASLQLHPIFTSDQTVTNPRGWSLESMEHTETLKKDWRNARRMTKFWKQARVISRMAYWMWNISWEVLHLPERKIMHTRSARGRRKGKEGKVKRSTSSQILILLVLHYCIQFWALII